MSILAYKHVLQPLKVKVSPREWDGVRWEHLIGHKHHTYVIGVKAFGSVVLQIATFDDPAQTDLPRVEHSAWEALRLWSEWAWDRARLQGLRRTPKDWLIFATFPGRQELIPPRWLLVAKQTQCTWEEWKLACEAMHIGEYPMTRLGIDPALGWVMRKGTAAAREHLRAAKAKREEVNPRGRRLLAKGEVQKDFPADWERVLKKMCAGISTRSRTVYRSAIRRVAREANSFDLETCAGVADTLPKTPKAIWDRFYRLMNDPGDLQVAEATPAWVQRREKSFVRRQTRTPVRVGGSKPTPNHAPPQERKPIRSTESEVDLPPVVVETPAFLLDALRAAEDRAKAARAPRGAPLVGPPLFKGTSSGLPVSIPELPTPPNPNEVPDAIQEQIRHVSMDADSRDWLAEHMLREHDKNLR